MIVQLQTERLLLDPLEESDAEEMAAVLADPALYLHTGGEPPDAATLGARYARQSVGASPDGSQRWFNWIVRTREPRAAVGYVQATLWIETGIADMAWVVGAPFQRRGYASEAAGAVTAWLTSRPDVRRVTAHVATANVASEGVARRLGFTPTTTVEHGEVVWELPARPRPG